MLSSQRAIWTLEPSVQMIWSNILSHHSPLSLAPGQQKSHCNNIATVWTFWWSGGDGGWLVLSDLTDTAGREPEHVLHQAVSVGMQRDQLLLDELLVTLGGQTQGDGAETAAVVRTGNNARC